MTTATQELARRTANAFGKGEKSRTAGKQDPAADIGQRLLALAAAGQRLTMATFAELAEKGITVPADVLHKLRDLDALDPMLAGMIDAGRERERKDGNGKGSSRPANVDKHGNPTDRFYAVAGKPGAQWNPEYPATVTVGGTDSTGGPLRPKTMAARVALAILDNADAVRKAIDAAREEYRNAGIDPDKGNR